MKKIILLLILLVPTLMAYAQKERWDDNKVEWSELMIAIYNCDTGKYNTLIRSGIDVNYETPAIKSNFKLTALEIAIRKDNDNTVKALLQTNKIKHPGRYIMTASGQNNAITIDLLIDYGANPNETLKNGYSTLMMAASFGSYEVLRCLLKHGASVKQSRKVDGITALMLAAFNGQTEKVKLLLNYKADKNIKDKNGHTALYYVDMIYPYLNISENTKAKLRSLLK
jgi:ankyrin repeat protein